MKVLGVITEYNPFHNGHLHHLVESKKITGADYTVCVMSGNFIQRGEPALLNKWARTEMAIKNGIDLVIELPVSYVLQSAESFAHGAIKILDSLNIIDHICFGSEIGEIEPLQHIAQTLVNEPKEISNQLKQLLNKGYSFPKARELAVTTYFKKQKFDFNVQDIMSSPNNILGIEYLKALYRLNSPIKPATIKRHKTGYHSLETQDDIASATAIRTMLQDNLDLENIKKYIPQCSYNVLMNEITAGRIPIFTESFDSAIITLLRKLSASALETYPDVGEGLEHRIIKAAHTCGTVENMIDSIKTKRYTRTRLQRIIYNVLLGITKDMLNTFQHYGGSQYIRVLGLNEKGMELIKIAKKRASLPIFVKTASYKKSCNPLLRQMIELDFLASDLYTLHYLDVNQRKGRIDFLTSPIVAKTT